MKLNMVRRVVIAEHERGLYFKDRTLERVLEPGVLKVFDPFGRIDIEVFDVTAPAFDHPRAELFARTRPELVATYFDHYMLAESEAGIVYVEGVLTGVLPPGTRALFWKASRKVDVEVVDVSDRLDVPAKVLHLLARPRSALLGRTLAPYVQVAEVPDQGAGLLFVDGVLVRTLAPGLHAFWTFNRQVKVELIELRLTSVEVQGQEILSKDKVTLRANLSATYKVTDPVAARTTVAKYVDYLYRELQFALRQAIGTRTLDQLLGDKHALENEVYEQTRAKVRPHGIELTGVGVKDLVLPGDMKQILNQVVEAEKVAQANVVKRREETAATRSLLNTAKLMDDNATLLRLKELEALEKVADKVDRLTVFGGLDGVLNDTVRLGLDAS